MKRDIIRGLDPLVSIGVALFGGWLIYASLLREDLNSRVLDLLDRTPLFCAALGGFLVLSLVLRIAARVGLGNKSRYINFDSEDGSVGISTKAICDFVDRVGREFSAIRNVESRLHDTRGGLDIVIAVKVQSGNRIPELSHVLQRRVRESIRESLGLESIRNITIKVKEIVGDPGKRAASEPQE